MPTVSASAAYAIAYFVLKNGIRLNDGRADREHMLFFDIPYYAILY